MKLRGLVALYLLTKSFLVSTFDNLTGMIRKIVCDFANHIAVDT